MEKKILKHDNPIKGMPCLAIGDFWAWAYSDLLSNTIRPLFAEYMVGSTLGLVDKPRIEWNAYDFEYRGKKIEVKSAGYLQSWSKRPSKAVRFDIAKKKSWYADTNTYSMEAIRASDIYVFCLFHERDPQQANVLNVSQWTFWVLGTRHINREFGDNKFITPSRLSKIISPIGINSVRTAVDRLIQGGDNDNHHKR